MKIILEKPNNTKRVHVPAWCCWVFLMMLVLNTCMHLAPTSSFYNAVERITVREPHKKKAESETNEQYQVESQSKLFKTDKNNFGWH
jgi:hypothetical protein